MSRIDEPRSEFVEHLEWQVRTAIRRRERFSTPAYGNGGRTMKMALLILASALLGAGGAVVSQEVQESRVQELLLARVDRDQRLAELEVEVRRNRMEEVNRQYESGMVTEEALLEARLALREAETRLARLHLDREEIEIAGRDANNTVSAPLVDGRDFVLERLALEAEAAEEDMNLVRYRLDRAQRLRETGVVEAEEVLEARLAVKESEARLREIRSRMVLRERFLAGEISSDEAEREAELTATRSQIDLRQMILERLRERFEQMSLQRTSGLIREERLDRTRLELMQAETQLEYLKMKLQALRLQEAGGGAAGEENGRATGR